MASLIDTVIVCSFFCFFIFLFHMKVYCSDLIYDIHIKSYHMCLMDESHAYSQSNCNSVSSIELWQPVSLVYLNQSYNIQMLRIGITSRCTCISTRVRPKISGWTSNLRSQITALIPTQLELLRTANVVNKENIASSRPAIHYISRP